jgi:pimeloyl-ACP methyl ester carboxylesterase
MLAKKRIFFASLTVLIALAVTACSAGSSAVTYTPENTPLPTGTPTLEKTASFTETPSMVMEQRPLLPTPELEGDFDVGGGHFLTYQCYGKGSPTIIVEAGAGDKPTLTLSWNAVVLGVYPITRICIYDRVPATTSQDVAENLHMLLSKIPVPGPYILVAHSLGGWHARVFAHLYPEEVAGLILVDTTATFPDAAITYATAYPTFAPNEPAGLTQNRMSETDIYSGTMLSSMDGLDMIASNEQVRQAGSFGNIPLVVISQTPGPDDFPGLDPATQKQLASLIMKIQADLANLSSKGVFMAATTSQHFISLYQPQIIIDAINKMVEEVRKQ